MIINYLVQTWTPTGNNIMDNKFHAHLFKLTYIII